MKEIWETIEKYSFYQISNLGRIRSRRTEKNIILKQSVHYKGHKFIYLYKSGFDRKKFFVHRLVAEAFIPNPENKQVVNHIDENKKNNKVENLEWMTSSENTKYYHKMRKANL